jgi:hypothetical protein
MSATPLQFQCPHCAQTLEIEVLPPNPLVQCPTCTGGIQLERPLASTREEEARPTNPTGANLGRLAPAVLIGAAIAYLLTWNSWLTLVGALFGFLCGQHRNRRAAGLVANDPRWLRWQALAGLRSAAISWIVLALMWSWVLTRPRETFNDQGGMLLTLFVLPLTLALWILGGPVAFARGWRNRWRATSPAVDGWVIVGLILSGLLMLAGALLVMILARR